MKKYFILILYFLYCNMGFGQNRYSENLTKQIEMIKESFRTQGLKNIDQIEGIYKFKVELSSEGYTGDLSSLNKRITKTVYAAIISREDNISEFEIWEYSDSKEEFLLRTTNWTIKKWYRNSINDFYYQTNCNLKMD